MNNIELKINHLVKSSTIDEDENGQNVSYIVQYLSSLGIARSDVSSFIVRPRDNDLDDPMLLDNMSKAVSEAYRLCSEGSPIFIIVDSDTDGYTSSSILINYLRRRFPSLDIQFHLHPGKEHGIVLEDIPADRQLIFVPDAGTNDIEQQKVLHDQGKTVIILDHHERNEGVENPDAILVNNQTSSRFTNKYLSGAGIVYMFILAMDRMYFMNDPIATDYLDLAAVGIIADAMKMTSLGNNYIAYHGLSHIKSQLLHEIALKQAHGIKNPDHLTKIDVAFYIAPIINGVIRSGDPEDKMAVFTAMSTEGSTEEVATVWRGVTRHESIYQYAARLAANAKSRQDTAKRKSFEWLCDKIRTEGHDKDNIIIAALDDAETKKVNPSLTGLIAMELVKEFNRPVLVLRHTELDGKEVYAGSGRNGNFYGLSDLKAYLTKQVYYTAGHPNAFGAFLLPDEIDQVRTAANEQFNPATFETVYEVDYIFHSKYDIDLEMLYQIASCDYLWGNSIPQPKFAFTVDYGTTDVMIMGKDRSSLKIRCGSLDFVAFKNEALVQKISEIRNGTATIVGRAQLNSFNGNTNVQVIIDDIELAPREEVITRPHSMLDLI